MSLAFSAGARVRPEAQLSDSVYARGRDFVLYRGDSLELMEQKR